MSLFARRSNIIRESWSVPANCPDSVADMPAFENPPRKQRKSRSKAEQKTNPYESRIQKGIVKDLRRTLALGYIVQAFCEHRDPDEKLRAKLMGSEPGWPDLGVFGDGRCWLLELKDQTGRLNDNQEIMHPLIVSAGIPLRPICRSFDDAVAFLKANGARFRSVDL